MANIQDYLTWRGDISFKNFPFNEVDNLILAELSYINLEKLFITKKKCTVQEAIDFYLNTYTESQILKKFPLAKNPVPFFKLLAASKRFANLKILNYESVTSKKEEKQFAALMVEINPVTVYVSFRGTDDTLVGWKEDFNMSFMSPIPSQKYAFTYLNNNISLKHRIIYLGGHSKGGNLAVYAGVMAKKSIKKKIRKIYNNDGPGFDEEFISTPQYNEMLPKIETIVPATSIVGLLLGHKEHIKVVKSDAIGLWQHDALSWQVSYDQFITVDSVDNTSSKLKQIITSWLNNISKEERAIFINAIYDILVKCNINTIEDLTKLKIYKIPNIIQNFSKLDVETRKMIIKFFKLLINETKENFNEKGILKSIGLLK